jgi:hypothetical protein
MAWGTKGTSTALTLGASYATVQEAAADLTITLNPAEGCLLILDAAFQATPTEDADVLIVKSVDGTEYESDGEAERHIISVANRETDNPAERSVWVTDCHTFKVRARVRNPDDTVGGTDTTSTLTIHYRSNGISA